ncbi:MAG: oxidoreductase [Novosphingobium sp.]|nr:oxidoreductase [Novosphingobium sp.]
MSGFTDKDVTDQSGRCFMVTGANTGLGFEVSKVLASRGARVLMACRNQAKAEAAIDQIREDVPSSDLAFIPIDMADLDSAREAALVAAQEPRLDVLINNAGVMFPPLEHTKQGFELQWGVNHLAPFALTGLLLPKLAEGHRPRIVFTASLAHRRGNIAWDDLNAENSYSRTKRYSDSKLANLLHAFELERRLRASGSPIVTATCHPGFASTDLARHLGAVKFLFPIAGMLFNSAEQGAWPTLQAATGEIESGEYYGPQRLFGTGGVSDVARRSKASRDPQAACRLWEVSVHMTGVEPGLPPA